MHFCFIRPNELRRIKVGDIHGAKIQIRGEIAKNTKTEYVVIPKPLRKVIEEHELRKYPKHFYIFGKDGKPSPYCFGVNHFSNVHRKILRELDFSQKHKLYSWKHTGVLYMKEQGADVHDIKRQLRHHSLAMVDEYLKDLGLMENTIAKMDFSDL